MRPGTGGECAATGSKSLSQLLVCRAIENAKRIVGLLPRGEQVPEMTTAVPDFVETLENFGERDACFENRGCEASREVKCLGNKS